MPDQQPPPAPKKAAGSAPKKAAGSAPKKQPAPAPAPDQFGRLRVTDKDTGHKRSISASELPHGNYTVLKDPASLANGDAVPTEFNAVEPVGQSATTTKEKP